MQVGHVRQRMTRVALAAAVVALPLAWAMSASPAAAATGQADCGSVPAGVTEVPVTLAPGETLSLQVENCSGGVLRGDFWADEGASVEVTFANASISTYTFAFDSFGPPDPTFLVFTAPLQVLPADPQFRVSDADSDILFVITVAEPVPGEPSSEAAGIPDWVQSYGRGAQADSCVTGWSASWEQWPNGGAGGWVCTRSIPSLG